MTRCVATAVMRNSESFRMSGDTVWSIECILRLNESIQHTIARPCRIHDSDFCGRVNCPPWMPSILDTVTSLGRRTYVGGQPFRWNARCQPNSHELTGF